MSREPNSGEIYLEFRPVGRQVQVIAMDAATGIEVSAFGPASASQEDLKRIVVRKLQRRILQERQAGASQSDPTLY
ncbi:serine hydroxymethyltransferase [Labrenzia sp. 011]|uniref:DUF6898 family protein n=1 Tax=Labrenzia sp. 011 TaxID=2171494 RepID=UPI000D50AC7C|nr:serine hydroxymethyltransferase [Labrenzia sp. 011]PVB63276.1 serine hydroxymethyltransferase [Labrenzia sp. 011]